MSRRNELGIAVCCQLKVPRRQKASLEFSLSWDMPCVNFGGRKRVFYRRYTKWFGIEGDAAPQICVSGLKNLREWERQIEAWQNPVLSDVRLPDWYKSALFNELYFLTDGGSVWFEFDERWLLNETLISKYTADVWRNIGRFGYLESWEYLMINTYDVHFYASVSLARLWPELEHAIQAEFCDQFFNEDHSRVRFMYDGSVNVRKQKYAIPHDLGNPGTVSDEPWLQTNAYVMHNTAHWKDLNTKFILTCYRDYLLLHLDKSETFPFDQIIETGLEQWDVDGDGMIEQDGKCDQTYDIWCMNGTRYFYFVLLLFVLKYVASLLRLIHVFLLLPSRIVTPSESCGKLCCSETVGQGGSRGLLKQFLTDIQNYPVVIELVGKCSLLRGSQWLPPIHEHMAAYI
ncbi:unnamed protein product [Soboliphyme baturini]|uniref:Non-lysosomal glucosylceramidase n=1 Tax=Soboliphyme baturini TaxID=241478 RepID=A0A183J1L7_9BILA|nr:unnamed protein product [Soboliphyme baturini]